MVTNPFISPVGPDFSIPTQYPNGNHPVIPQIQGQEDEPPLYGQNQFKDGYGPVYAVPTYPWNDNPGQNIGNSQGPPIGNHPDLFDENQFKDGFSPVYAAPTYPWHPPTNVGSPQEQYTHWQSTRAGQWQKSDNCPRSMKVYYMYPYYCMYPAYGYGHNQCKHQ